MTLPLPRHHLPCHHLPGMEKPEWLDSTYYNVRIKDVVGKN